MGSRRDFVVDAAGTALGASVATLDASAQTPATKPEPQLDDRIMYLRNYLTQLQRATADGVPVNGYFQWSTMDDFEWNAGFGNRFGLVYVDFKTQKRTPKLSADWFREAARRNAVCSRRDEVTSPLSGLDLPARMHA